MSLTQKLGKKGRFSKVSHSHPVNGRPAITTATVVKGILANGKPQPVDDYPAALVANGFFARLAGHIARIHISQAGLFPNLMGV